MHATVGLLQRCGKRHSHGWKIIVRSFARDIRFPYRRRETYHESPTDRSPSLRTDTYIRSTWPVLTERRGHRSNGVTCVRTSQNRERTAKITRWKYRLFPFGSFDIPSVPVKLRIVRGRELQFYGLAVFAKLPSKIYFVNILATCCLATSRQITELQSNRGMSLGNLNPFG